jgi:hypothetical protein
MPSAPTAGTRFADQRPYVRSAVPSGKCQNTSKEELAIAHLRKLIPFLSKDDVVVRETDLWEEHPNVGSDVRPLLRQMEEDGEITRFAGYYRVQRRPPTAAEREEQQGRIGSAVGDKGAVSPDMRRPTQDGQ